jgi:uncharacterized protein (DUF58 family)
MDRSDFNLSPETLSRLANLEIRARLVVEGFVTGMHKSPYHGFSVEFAEHRQYMPGDELKHIDWKVLAKTDRYYVKRYEEETNLQCYILLDASKSMEYGSRSVTKIQYASYLAASLAFFMLKQRDAVGLATFADVILDYVPPRSVQSYLIHILQVLENLKPQGTTDVGSAFHALADRIKRRGLVIIISDLFDDPEKVVSGLKHFRYKNHEVLVFHVLDPMEYSFAFEKEAVFYDMETNDEVFTLPRHIKGDYKAQLQKLLKYYKRICSENSIDYILLNTETELDKALSDYLMKRKRLY